MCLSPAVCIKAVTYPLLLAVSQVFMSELSNIHGLLVDFGSLPTAAELQWHHSSQGACASHTGYTAMGIQISPGGSRKRILKSCQRKTKAKRHEVLLPCPGAMAAEASPGREASCTLLGCKHTDRLVLHLFPAVKSGLLLNFQKQWNAKHESYAWSEPGASPASCLCPRGCCKGTQRGKLADRYNCWKCLARSAEL